MSDKSHIEWTDATWNPTVGCTKVSPGCDHCYAETFVNRFAGSKGFPLPFDQMHLRGVEHLTLPLRWQKPRKVFVNSLSDLFHDDVPDKTIAEVFAVMAVARRHTFQLLTKRHGRMRALLSSIAFANLFDRALCDMADWNIRQPAADLDAAFDLLMVDDKALAPLPNVWLGVSVEDQKWARTRLPALLDTPAAVRWVSAEPLLGPLDLGVWLHDVPDLGPRLNWVVVGGESGTGARPMHPDWPRQIRDECADAGVPFLFKQWGTWAPGSNKGHREVVVARDDGHTISPPHVLWEQPGGPDELNRKGWAFVHHAGKKTAGRELDGRTYDGYPTPLDKETV